MNSRTIANLLILCTALQFATVNSPSILAEESLNLGSASDGYIWDGAFDPHGLGIIVAPRDGIPDGTSFQNFNKSHLIVQRVESVLGSVDAGANETRSVIEFDLLANVPASASVQSATLHLTSVSAGSPAAGVMEIWGYLGANLQLDLADYNRQANLIGAAEPIIVDGSATTIAHDVKSFVQAAVDQRMNPGFRLQISPELESYSVQFSSTIDGTATHPAPFLEIHWSLVPEPSAILLALVAGSFLLARPFGRRRQCTAATPHRQINCITPSA